MEISKRNDLVKTPIGAMFANYCFPVRKKPPYFLLNARSHFDMTLGIPPFTEHHRTIRSTSGSNPHISSRLKLAHDHSSGGFSRTHGRRRSCPINSSVTTDHLQRRAHCALLPRLTNSS